MALSEQECKSDGKSRTTHTATESSKSIGPISSDTGMSKKSNGPKSSQLTLSVEDSPVSQSQSLEAGKGRRMRDGSGQISFVPFAKYDLSTHSWRTFLGCSQLTIGDLPEECTRSWPKQVIIHDDVAYQPKMSEHRRRESASLLWPTPRTRGLLGGSGSRQMVQLLVKSGILDEEEATQLIGVKLWPTPQARDCTRKTSVKRDRLPDRLRGTPNPTWVEWLMGFPLEWTKIESSVSETQSSRKSQNTSEDSSSNTKKGNPE